MHDRQMLQFLINERLSEAAEKILALFDKAVAEYQKEIFRLKKGSDAKRAKEDFRNPPVSLKGAPQIVAAEQKQEENSELCHFKEEPAQVVVTLEEDETQRPITNEKRVGDDELQPRGQQTHDSSRPTFAEKDSQMGCDEQPGGSDASISGHPRHYMPCDPDRPFTCTVCHKKFKFKLSMEAHMRAHAGEDPYCTECGLRFLKRSWLSQHINNAHVIHIHKCTVCNEVYSYPKALKKHMESHQGETLFRCALCGRQYAGKDALQSHMATHSGEKPLNSSN